MRLAAAGDHRNDGSYPKFDGFLNRPLHAIKLEDGEQQSDLPMMGSCSINSLVQNKFHTIEAYARKLAAAHASISRYIELLTDLSPKNSCKVSSPLANKRGAIAF